VGSPFSSEDSKPDNEPAISIGEASFGRLSPLAPGESDPSSMPGASVIESLAPEEEIIDVTPPPARMKPLEDGTLEDRGFLESPIRMLPPIESGSRPPSSPMARGSELPAQESSRRRQELGPNGGPGGPYQADVYGVSLAAAPDLRAVAAKAPQGANQAFSPKTPGPLPQASLLRAPSPGHGLRQDAGPPTPALDDVVPPLSADALRALADPSRAASPEPAHFMHGHPHGEPRPSGIHLSIPMLLLMILGLVAAGMVLGILLTSRTWP
jgi:hypothetical protein